MLAKLKQFRGQIRLDSVRWVPWVLWGALT